jgi:hypothetical protein
VYLESPEEIIERLTPQFLEQKGEYADEVLVARFEQELLTQIRKNTPPEYRSDQHLNVLVNRVAAYSKEFADLLKTQE